MIDWNIHLFLNKQCDFCVDLYIFLFTVQAGLCSCCAIYLCYTYFEKYHRSGLLSEEYERKKQAMQKAEEDTTFSLHKKKVIFLIEIFVIFILSILIISICYQSKKQTIKILFSILISYKLLNISIQGITAEKKEAKAEKDEASKYEENQKDLVSSLF